MKMCLCFLGLRWVRVLHALIDWAFAMCPPRKYYTRRLGESEGGPDGGLSGREAGDAHRGGFLEQKPAGLRQSREQLKALLLLNKLSSLMSSGLSSGHHVAGRWSDERLCTHGDGEFKALASDLLDYVGHR
jgi:hypothetical protein